MTELISLATAAATGTVASIVTRYIKSKFSSDDSEKIEIKFSSGKERVVEFRGNMSQEEKDRVIKTVIEEVEALESQSIK